MKKILLFFMLISHISFAQKNELGLQINSGLFNFKGENIPQNGYVKYQDLPYSIQASNRFGGDYGLNIGIATNYKWVSKINLFLAAEFGFDYSNSRLNINKIYSNIAENAKGTLNLRLANIYFAPIIGYRLKVQKVNIDLGIGIDICRILNSSEKLFVSADTRALKLQYTKTLSIQNDNTFDLRPHANIKVAYQKFGISCGFSKGTTNYEKRHNTILAPPTNAQLWRIGFSYIIS